MFQVLHLAWAVPHPSFLISDFLGRTPSVVVEDQPVAASVLGRARSVEELRTWVVASLAELTTELIKTDADNETLWRSVEGHAVWVLVAKRDAIELRSVLARGVSFKRAHELADKLTARRPGLRFYLRLDTMIMSQFLPASPYVGEHLVTTLGRFISARDEFGWVADKVLAKRVRLERGELDKQKALNAELLARLGALGQSDIAEGPVSGGTA